LLNIALCSFAAALFAGPLRLVAAHDRTVRIPWVVLAGIFYLTERFVIHVHFRRDAESFSLSEIPLVIALFFVAPLQLMTAQLVGAGVALVFNRKQSVMKLVFNLGQFAAGSGIACATFRLLTVRGGALDIEDTMRALLEQVRRMFRAEIARVTLFPSDGEPNALRTVLGPGDGWTFMDSLVLDPRKGVWARVASEGQAVVVQKPIRNERLRAYFEEEGGMRDAMVAPLFGDGCVIGTLLVANR